MTRPWYSLPVVVALVAVALTFAGTAVAQTRDGILRVVVLDPSGAVIVNATVRLLPV